MPIKAYRLFYLLWSTKKVRNVNPLHETAPLPENFNPSAQPALLFDKVIAHLSQYHPFPQTQADCG